MDRSRLDIWTDRVIVAILFVIVVTGPLLMGALRDQDFFWIEMLTASAGLVAVLRLIALPGTKLFVPQTFWCAVLFVAYAVARYWTADLEYVARKELLWLLTYLIIFLLALNHLHQPQRAIALFIVLLVLGMGMSLFALRQHITGSNQVWHLLRPAYTFRGSGTFIYPNHFAGFIELVLPFGIAALFLGPFQRKAKVGIAYCTLWLIIGLYVSLSRAGWIAGLLGVFVLLPLVLRNRQGQIWGFAITIVLLLVGLSWELKTGQFRKRFETMTGQNPQTDLTMRLKIWNCAWQVWRAEPIFGAGPGHFDHRFRPWRDRILQGRPGRAHNDYLDLIADWGVVGAIPILLALFFLFWRAGKEWLLAIRQPNEAPTARRLIVIVGLASLISILAHSFVDYQMHVPANAILTLVVAAVVLAQTQGMDSQTWKALGKLRLTAAALLLGTIIIIGWQGTKMLRERLLLDLAAQQSGTKKIATLEAAFRLEPTNFETAYWLGESYRLWSWSGEDGYKQLARQAIEWFSKASALNPFEPYAPMRIGMCLDWSGRRDESEPYYRRALSLDPQNHVVLANYGWHHFQAGNYEESWKWFVESYARNFQNNEMAVAYFRLLQEKLQK